LTEKVGEGSKKFAAHQWGILYFNFLMLAEIYVLVSWNHEKYSEGCCVKLTM
jgi:hypothetical protein